MTKEEEQQIVQSINAIISSSNDTALATLWQVLADTLLKHPGVPSPFFVDMMTATYNELQRRKLMT